MENFGKTIIALVSRTTESNKDIGFADPVAFTDQNGENPIQASKYDFPNSGRIFVMGTSELGLDTNISTLIRGVPEESNSYIQDDQSSAKWAIRSRDYDVVKRWDVIEIINQQTIDRNNKAFSISFRPLVLFLIRNESDNKLYGPFQADSVTPSEDSTNYNESYICEYSTINPMQIPRPFLEKINGERFAALSITDNAEIQDFTLTCDGVYKREFLATKNLRLSESRLIDFASDQEMGSWLGSTAKHVNNPKEILESLKIVQDAFKISTVAESELFKDRMKRLGGAGNALAPITQNSDKKRLSTAEVNKYISDNWDEVIKLSPHRAKILETIRSEEAEAQKQLSTIIKETKQIREKNSLAQRAQEITERKLAEKRLEFEDLEKKADSIIDKREEKRKLLIEATTREIELLESRKKSIQEENLQIQKQNEQLNESTAILNGKLVEFKRELTEKLIVHASLTDALAGRRVRRALPKSIILPEYENFSNDDDIRDFVIQRFKSALLLNNREISNFDTACMTTLICQSFISIFYGKPGTGKTSLAKILSRLFSNGNNGSESIINVQRGWMRSDEILGFHNALNNSREYDQYGFFESLERFNISDEYLKSQYLTVILDEANLSPLEHYWSEFIGISDDFWSNPTIVKFMNNESDENESSEIKIPSGLRFLATINIDSTTEPLSDRLINRASFVHMHEPENIGSPEPLESIDPLNIRATDLNRAFYLNRIPDGMTSNDKNLSELKRNYEILNLTPRKENALRRFLSVIEQSKYFEDRNPAEALDQGIKRLVLPGIKGEGRESKIRLESLADDLTNRNLQESSQSIRTLIEVGTTKGQYYRGLDVL